MTICCEIIQPSSSADLQHHRPVKKKLRIWYHEDPSKVGRDIDAALPINAGSCRYVSNVALVSTVQVSNVYPLSALSPSLGLNVCLIDASETRQCPDCSGTHRLRPHWDGRDLSVDYFVIFSGRRHFQALPATVAAGTHRAV